MPSASPLPLGVQDASFRAFRRFNRQEDAAVAGLRERIDNRVLALFDGPSMPDRIARELARRRVVKMKEVFESFEFFERVRRRVRRPVMVDLCAGHGLTGVLFAAFERSVERVFLVDLVKPPSHARLMEAVGAVAPWVHDKVEFVVDHLRVARDLEPQPQSVIAVHACGVRTDRTIDVALDLGVPLAVMPCCYAQTAADAPRAMHKALGIELATDIHRTYRLEAAGYHVEWGAVPRVITDKNRVLVGLPGAEPKRWAGWAGAAAPTVTDAQAARAACPAPHTHGDHQDQQQDQRHDQDQQQDQGAPGAVRVAPSTNTSVTSVAALAALAREGGA